jgi:rare lipoprotein A
MLNKIKMVVFISSFILSGCVATSPYATTSSANHNLPQKSSMMQKKKPVIASWYGRKFHHRRTSSGERYNMYQLTAAHKTLPINTYLQVTNLLNGKKVVVRVNDRGPFVRNREIDLSYAAAKQLGMLGRGLAPVELEKVHNV